MLCVNGFIESVSWDGKNTYLPQPLVAGARKSIEKNGGVGFVSGKFDQSLTMTYASYLFLSSLGYELFDFRTFTQEKFINIVYEADRDFFQSEYFFKLEGYHEFRLILSSQHPIWVTIYKENYQYQDETYWIMSVNIERESLNLNLINHVIQSGLWYIDYDEQGNRCSIHFSRQFRQMLGFTQEKDFPNQLDSLIHRVHPSDYNRVIDEIIRAESTNVPGKNFDVQCRVKNIDENFRWYRAAAALAFRPNGKLERMTGIFVDISEEHAIEIGLENTLIHVFWYYPKKHLLQIPNKTAEALKCQTSYENAPESFCQECIDPSYIQIGYDLFKSIEQGQTSANGIVVMKSQEPIWMQVTLTATLFDNDGKTNMAVGIIEDITQEKNNERIYHEELHAQNEHLRLSYEQKKQALDHLQIAQEKVEKSVKDTQKLNESLRQANIRAQQANVAKSRFLTQISHDIRTPMNGIIGMAQIAKENLDDKKTVSDAIEKILVASKQLRLFMADVLELSNIEGGMLKVSHEPFNLQSLLNDITSQINERIIEKQIHLNTSKEITHPIVVGNPSHLHRILQNIIDNAIKFNHVNGTIFLSVKEFPIDQTHANYLFTIEDTGIGMSEEFLEKLYEPFEQALQTARSNYNGTGLGTTIARELVDRLGGSIKVRSQEHIGTCFEIEVPFEIGQEVQNNHEIQANLEGMNVLLVEDNDLNMEIANYILNRLGIHVTQAVNGRQAYDLFIHSKPNIFDLILMDIMMPEMDGLQATRCIRESDHAQAGRIPIVAMTANAYSEDIEKSIKAGMNEHISKPIESEQLKEVCARYYGHTTQIQTGLNPV